MAKFDDAAVRARLRRSLDDSIRRGGYDPAVVIHEQPASPTASDIEARERLMYRDVDPLIRVPEGRAF
jgi:hypothetical protein